MKGSPARVSSLTFWCSTGWPLRASAAQRRACAAAALQSVTWAPESIMALIRLPLRSASTMVSWPSRRRAAPPPGPSPAGPRADLVISSCLVLKPSTRRWPFSQSTPSTPSTPALEKGRDGAFTALRLREPTCRWSMTTHGPLRGRPPPCARGRSGRASAPAGRPARARRRRCWRRCPCRNWKGPWPLIADRGQHVLVAVAAGVELGRRVVLVGGLDEVAWAGGAAQSRRRRAAAPAASEAGGGVATGGDMSGLHLI